MELTVTIILWLVIGALVCEFIDSSLGMMYGTILSPVLIIIGFDPLLVIPSILFSQAIGGFTAAMFHHRLGNADFTPRKGLTEDLRITFCIVSLGILATIFSVFVAVSIPKVALKTYIGVLVLVMGTVLLLKSRFKFSWKKMIGISLISAFNKGLSGGGFGPIITSGQMIFNRKSKSSIGATTLAEAPICITAFLTYFFTKGIQDWGFVLLLTGGAVAGALIGPHLTKLFKSERKLKIGLGTLVIALGIWTLIKTWLI